MTYRKYRYLNSPNSLYSGRRNFFTPTAETTFKHDTFYLLSEYNPADGNMTDRGVQLLEDGPGYAIFVWDLGIETYRFDLVDGKWKWEGHEASTVMFEAVDRQGIKLVDPHEIEGLQVVDITFDGQEDGAFDVFIGENGEVTMTKVEEEEELDELDDDSSYDDPPEDWVDDCN